MKQLFPKTLTLSLALIAGLILPLAFAPFCIYPFAFVSPAILLYLWLHGTSRDAFLQGFFYGLGLFGMGASWVYISIHNYGNASAPLALLITVLFIIVLSLFTAFQGMIFRLFRHKNTIIQVLLIFPSTWVMQEALRGWVFTGFPWLLLGNSQTISVLFGFAPVIGVYGLSFLVALMNGCLLLICTHRKNSVKIVSSLLVVLFLLLGAALSSHTFTKPIGKTLTVSLIQGNISQSIKWNTERLFHILDVYNAQTEKYWTSDVVVWPEAAIPTFPEEIPNTLSALNAKAQKHHTTFIFGAPIYDEKNQKIYNGLKILGNGSGLYLKRHLVPFGEYTPLHFIFGKLMNHFNIPMSDLTPGPDRQKTLYVGLIPTSAYICYEISYTHQVLHYSKNTELIISINDDSWFGQSLARAQQLQIAAMRAAETGRYVLYATNTGITAIINPHGSILKQLPPDERATLTGTVTAMTGNTPLMKWNYYPVWILIILCIILSMI